MVGQNKFLRIRVDDETDNFDLFKTFLESKGCKILLACRENPADENPHFHALVEGKCSLEALRTARKRYFKDIPKMKGNGVASMSECDKYEEFIEYLCKGEKVIKDKVDLIYKNPCKPNITINELGINVKDYHKKFWQRHQKDAPRKPKSYNNHKCFTRKVLEDWCKDHDIEVDGTKKSQEEEYEVDEEDELMPGGAIKIVEHSQLSVKQDVVEWLIDYLGANEKGWDDYIIIRYTNLIHWRYRHHFRHFIHTRQSQVNNILQKIGISDISD